MTYLVALGLGILQGVCEFLPVSSSGHLAVAHAIAARFGFEPMGPAAARTLDLMMHLATTCSILVVLGPSFLRWVREKPAVLLHAAAGTLPLAVLGLFTPLPALSDIPVRATVLLFGATAAWLFAAELFCPAQPRRRGMNLSDALLIGLAQVLAVPPGISRSGMTLGAGLLCGLERAEAFRFAFLLAIPANLGACWHHFHDLPPGGLSVGGPEAVACAAAFLSGCFALPPLGRILVRRGLQRFAGYLLLLSVVLALAL